MGRRGVAIGLAIGAAALFLIARPTIAISGATLTLAQVRALATKHKASAPRVPVEMAVAIAWIESNFRPGAFRVEAHIGDVSVGLMQTLIGTAQWVWDTFGVARVRPGFHELTDPDNSMLYGMLYLSLLHSWGGINRSEEWIVRAYNGGPGGAGSTATAVYWQRYREAREMFG